MTRQNRSRYRIISLCAGDDKKRIVGKIEVDGVVCKLILADTGRYLAVDEKGFTIALNNRKVEAAIKAMGENPKMEGEDPKKGLDF